MPLFDIFDVISRVPQALVLFSTSPVPARPLLGPREDFRNEHLRFGWVPSSMVVTANAVWRMSNLFAPTEQTMRRSGPHRRAVLAYFSL
jgi:hypothetical protein